MDIVYGILACLGWAMVLIQWRSIYNLRDKIMDLSWKEELRIRQAEAEETSSYT